MSQLSTNLFSSQVNQLFEDDFLALFPHRYDFIWAKHTHAQGAVEWQTERRYPLSDRQINQGSCLYGVRFGSKTNYSLLDIDIESPYHPQHDSFAIQRIMEALESLNLVSYIACTSSYSNGLHLYLPFAEPQSSWQVSIAITTVLENAGFKLTPGHLEVFPNPKPYQNDQSFSLSNAHRLPLQIGSYLLNQDFQPVWSSRITFVQHWNQVRSRNTLDIQSIKQVLKQCKRRSFRLSGKADKYLNDLNAEIEIGWTGFGQTNRLLGRIAMRSYVFHHVIAGGKPLCGQALIDEIVHVARSLPGYIDWCQHQHEIEHRAAEWARCIESSHYFHYGDQKGKFKAKSEELESAIDQTPSWNQKQSESARGRIRDAIADLLEKGILPSQFTQRFKVLLQYRIGGGSLYRHRDLWHPQFLMNDSLGYLGESKLENSPQNSASLLPSDGGNNNSSSHSSNSIAQNSDSVGGNSLIQHGSCCVAVDNQDEAISHSLIHAQAQQEACKTAVQLAAQYQTQNDAPSQKQIKRMQQFLDSGDPILIAEATAWAHHHPGVLDLKCVRSSNVFDRRLPPPKQI